MIGFVSLAEKQLGRGRKTVFTPCKALPKKIAAAEEVLPVLRGLLSIPAGADGEVLRWVFNLRDSAEIQAFARGKEVARYSQAGTVTPDHVIRTKPWPLVLPAPEAGRSEEHTSELQSLMRISYAVFCLKKKKKNH